MSNRNRKICMLMDVIVLVMVGIMMLWLFIRQPVTHVEVDRTEYPVKGIDLSAHNQTVDFDSVVADTVSFVMLKVTEGRDFCDANFSANYRKARNAGLKVGAYHFFRFNTPGEVQAQHFISSLSGRTLDLPLVLDVESWGNTSTYDKDAVKVELRKAVAEIQRAGYPVMIYTNGHGYKHFVKGEFEQLPLWICKLSSQPKDKQWILWQHSHQGTVGGVKVPVDINTYNGSAESFEAWCNKTRFTIQ